MQGWQYYKVLTIDNSSNVNALSDYQINLTIDTETPISQGKMQSNGADIRFLSSACMDLNYWIEKGINTTNTSIWIKLDYISSNSIDSIFMYYGNLSANPLSNGDSTFIVFDNFDDNSISPAWTVTAANWTENSGVIQSSGDGTYAYPRLRRVDVGGIADFYVQYDYKWSVAPPSTAGAWHSIKFNETPYVDHQMRSGSEYDTYDSFSGKIIDSDWPNDNNWHKQVITRFNDNWVIYLDDVNKGNANSTINVLDTITLRGPSNGWGFNANVDVDDFFVAKYTLPVPTNSISNEAIYSFSQDTCEVYDTTFVTVYDTIQVFDTTFVTLYDTITVYDTTFVTVYDTLQVIDTTYITFNDTITYYDTVLVSVTDTLIIDITLTDIAPPNNINTINIYPNPANDIVIIDNGNYANMTNYTLKIVNSLGQDVFNSLITIPQFQIPVNTLGTTGLYFIQIIDPSSQIIDTRKLILN